MVKCSGCHDKRGVFREGAWIYCNKCYQKLLYNKVKQKLRLKGGNLD